MANHAQKWKEAEGPLPPNQSHGKKGTLLAIERWCIPSNPWCGGGGLRVVETTAEKRYVCIYIYIFMVQLGKQWQTKGAKGSKQAR